ncbi:hypothetical protein [Mobilicoccus pelagius]|uniref:hypothetical protein n=1 Tax=Mobilicoccus pelagius TaxID=746032 RepID=UPI00145DC986|nr:hypothetical protein [Mobilicoccus pelagius]
MASSTPRSARRRGAVAVVGATIAVGAIAACGGIPPEPYVVGEAAGRGPSEPPALTAADVQAEFDAFVAAHPGEVSLAWAPVGAPENVQTLGATTDSDAWSTIKVPIAVAALTKAGGADGAPAERREQVRAAIEWSDNDAAARLYRSLGEGDAAEEAVQAVLRTAGDTRTDVDPDTGAVSGFGRTVWRVEDSAAYAAHLPCAPEATFVYDEMGRIREDQRWGLGALTVATRFKGGWGPSEHGHLVRQIGTVDHDGGRTAVAFVVRPEDDTHETGTATASALVTWLAGRLGPAEAGRCPGGDTLPLGTPTTHASVPTTDAPTSSQADSTAPSDPAAPTS